MPKVPQTDEELWQHLRVLVDFLRTDAAAYDAGNFAQARRLATTLRILVHNTASSRALLVQLRLRDKIRWLDTAGGLDEENLLTSSNLIGMRFDEDGVSYFPPLAEYPQGQVSPPQLQAMLQAHGRGSTRAGGQRLPFDLWWKGPVIKDDAGNVFGRVDLVTALANQDGGAHVDPGLDEAYHRLSRSNSLGWSAVDAAGARPLGNPVPACLRQIAYEADDSISVALPDLGGP